MAVMTTDGKAIQTPSRESITLYAPDGSVWTGAPVDARAILAAGLGYTTDPPAKHADEQQPEQQPILDNATEPEAEGNESEAEAEGEAAKPSKVSRKSK